MIKPKTFVDSMSKYGIEFYSGVPDSLLKDICAYISENIDDKQNIITANEGGAIGLAVGYHLATGKIPLVYMQNSGLGNAVNPLISLVDKKVYSIPLLLLIGWRGKPGEKDEPQHIKQGEITISLINTLGIKYSILSKEEAIFITQLEEAISYISKTNEPFAFIVEKETFENYKLNQNDNNNHFELTREEAIQIVASFVKDDDVIISTTGMISRELFEFRESKKMNHNCDFLTVGSMGHASQIALGIALEKSDRTVYCFDGDGAAIMHLGSLAIIASQSPKNYIHIVFNNGAHDSVGGQPTVGFQINFQNLSRSLGYKQSFLVSSREILLEVIQQNVKGLDGPIFIEIQVQKGNRKDLGRPNSSPIENKIDFMNYLNVKL